MKFSDALLQRNYVLIFTCWSIHSLPKLKMTVEIDPLVLLHFSLCYLLLCLLDLDWYVWFVIRPWFWCQFYIFVGLVGIVSFRQWISLCRHCINSHELSYHWHLLSHRILFIFDIICLQHLQQTLGALSLLISLCNKRPHIQTQLIFLSRRHGHKCFPINLPNPFRRRRNSLYNIYIYIYMI